MTKKIVCNQLREQKSQAAGTLQNKQAEFAFGFHKKARYGLRYEMPCDEEKKIPGLWGCRVDKLGGIME